MGLPLTHDFSYKRHRRDGKMFNLNIKATMQSVTFEPNVCSSSDGITPQERGGKKSVLLDLHHSSHQMPFS